MPALFEVEGMIEDAHGTGFFRAAVITESELVFPRIQPGWVSVTKVVLAVDFIKDTRPSKLKIRDIFSVLHNDITEKTYRRSESGVWE